MQITAKDDYHLKVQEVMKKIDLMNEQLAAIHHVEYKKRKQLINRRSELYQTLRDLKYQASYK